VALESVSTDRVYVLEPAITVTVPNHEGMKVLTGGVTVAPSRLLPRCCATKTAILPPLLVKVEQI
jgi:hypothetical protein